MTRASFACAWLMLLGLAAPPAWAQAENPRPQAPPNVAEPHPDLPDPTAESEDAPVSLTGCLRRAKGEGGSSMLTLVVSPEPAGDGSAAPKTEYRVVAARPDLKLGDHVGHQVTLMGKLDVGSEDPSRRAPEPNDLVPPTVPSGSTGVDTIPDPPRDAAVAGQPPTLGGAPVSSTFLVSEVEMQSSQCSASPSS
jgi:hypothetical protein